MRKVYLHLYVGTRWYNSYCVHASVWIEGHRYEWTYGKSSHLATTAVLYRGLVFEKPRQYTYGEWKFWKAVKVGRGQFPRGRNYDVVRTKLKEAIGERFSDENYGVFGNNCWDCCLALLEVAGCPQKESYIENFMDQHNGWKKGRTHQWRSLFG